MKIFYYTLPETYTKGPYWEGEANKPSGLHPVNSAKASEGGQPLPDLWKHAEVGTTGSNQEKICLA